MYVLKNVELPNYMYDEYDNNIHRIKLGCVINESTDRNFYKMCKGNCSECGYCSLEIIGFDCMKFRINLKKELDAIVQKAIKEGCEKLKHKVDFLRETYDFRNKMSSIKSMCDDINSKSKEKVYSAYDFLLMYHSYEILELYYMKTITNPDDKDKKEEYDQCKASIIKSCDETYENVLKRYNELKEKLLRRKNNDN